MNIYQSEMNHSAIGRGNNIVSTGFQILIKIIQCETYRAADMKKSEVL